MMFRKIVIGSLIGCMLIVGAAPSVYAQSEDPPVCAPETDLLETLDKTREEVKTALAEGQTMEELFDKAGLDYEVYLQDFANTQIECINQAVEDGKITKSQADRMITTVEKGLEEGKPLFLGHRYFKRLGIQKFRFLSFGNIAESLDLSASELKTALQDGQTLTEIAAEQDVDIEVLFADWVETQIADIMQAVEDEKLTQAQADVLIEKMNRMLEDEFDFEHWNPFEHKGFDREKVILNSTKDLINQTMDALGMTVEDVRAAIQDGQAIEEITEEAGVDLDAVYQDWISEQMDAVRAALEKGKITQVQANRMSERLETQLENGFPIGFLKKARQERGNLFPFRGKGN